MLNILLVRFQENDGNDSSGEAYVRKDKKSQ